MEEIKYGKIINGKLYRVDKIIKENMLTISNPSHEQLKQFGYKKIELLKNGILDEDCISEDDETIYTNKKIYELKCILESPVSKLEDIRKSFILSIKEIISEINASSSKFQRSCDEILNTYSFCCSNKDFCDFVTWLENKYGKQWFKVFDVDNFLKSNGLDKNSFFVEANVPYSERLPIVAGTHKLQYFQDKREKNILFTSLYVFAHTKFDSSITKVLKIFSEEFPVKLEKELSKLSIEEKMKKLQEKISFCYKEFLPIHCRRNSVVHDEGILKEWRYNYFKSKCVLPFKIGENITPSVDNVFSEIVVMEELLNTICKKLIEHIEHCGKTK